MSTDTLESTEVDAESQTEIPPSHVTWCHSWCATKAMAEEPDRLYWSLCGELKPLSIKQGAGPECEQCGLLALATPMDLRQCQVCGVHGYRQ